ncbi:MAG: methyltransferase domain-containing protein [Nitrospirae bacterium]|nr:MAG: methyltransferase domain-containing protein [Nitrospirota bacterium]
MTGINRTAVFFLLLALLCAAPAVAQHKEQRRGPADLKDYIELLERPERDKDQKPDEVVKALNLDPYMTIADIGAGSGYFTRKFVWVLQDRGMVYAVDVEPGMLKYNEEMADHLHTPYNAKFVVAKEDDPLLPPKSVDLVFLCDTYHHLEKRADYFTRVKASLTKNGRVAIIDFWTDGRAGNLDFPPDHLVARETVLKEMSEAGYTLSKEHTFLPKQYFLEFVIAEKLRSGAEK